MDAVEQVSCLYPMMEAQAASKRRSFKIKYDYKNVLYVYQCTYFFIWTALK
jgi:hypothetical protein